MQFRVVKQKDIHQLLELMNNQYARKKSEKYFNWQYFNSSIPTILICADINGKIVGMFGLQKKRLTNGTVGGQAIDMLIHPEYRNQGIFYDLGNIALNYFNDLDFLFVLPNIYGKNAVLKNFDFKNLSSINNLILSKHDYIKTDVELETHTINYTFKFTYTHDYFNWRFINHSDYQYSKITIDERNYAFVKIFIDPISNIKYGDIVYFESNISTMLNRLIEKCCDYLFEEEISIITSWSLPNNISYEVFKRKGFKDVIQERYYCLKTIRNNMDDLYNIKNWCLFQSDTEFY